MKKWIVSVSKLNNFLQYLAREWVINSKKRMLETKSTKLEATDNKELYD